MKNRKVAAGVSIIGGSDGPTSIFIAGRKRRRGIRIRIREYLYKRKRINAEKIIIADPHTLEEVIRYMEENYNAVRISEQSNIYKNQRRNFREAFILKYKNEILTQIPEILRPKSCDEASVKEYLRQIEERSAKIEEIPEREFPIDFSIYRIKLSEKGEIQFTIEKNRNFFAGSFSGNQRAMIKYEGILKEIYLYYGVSEKDISERSERYDALVTVLALKTKS